MKSQVHMVSFECARNMRAEYTSILATQIKYLPNAFGAAVRRDKIHQCSLLQFPAAHCTAVERKYVTMGAMTHSHQRLYLSGPLETTRQSLRSFASLSTRFPDTHSTLSRSPNSRGGSAARTPARLGTRRRGWRAPFAPPLARTSAPRPPELPLCAQRTRGRRAPAATCLAVEGTTLERLNGAAEATASFRGAWAALQGAQELPEPPDGPGRQMGRFRQTVQAAF